MCPSSSLENGKQRKERTKGEWGAGAHLVAGSAGGAIDTWGVHGGYKGGAKGTGGLKPISSSSHTFLTLLCHLALSCSGLCSDDLEGWGVKRGLLCAFAPTLSCSPRRFRRVAIEPISPLNFYTNSFFWDVPLPISHRQ